MERIGDGRRAAARPLRRSRRDAADRRRLARRGRRRASRATPGLRASPATGRSTSTRARRSWAFELGAAGARTRSTPPCRARRRRADSAQLRPGAPARAGSPARGAAPPVVPRTLGGGCGRPPRWPPGSPTKSSAKLVAKSGCSQPRRTAATTARSDTLTQPAKAAICRAFFMAEAAYTAKDITVLEGLEPVRLRPGHVHRLDRPARPPSPRLRGGRQRRRRGPRRAQRPHRGHAPPGQLGHGPRRRPRHPGGRDRRTRACPR